MPLDDSIITFFTDKFKELKDDIQDLKNDFRDYKIATSKKIENMNEKLIENSNKINKIIGIGIGISAIITISLSIILFLLKMNY